MSIYLNMNIDNMCQLNNNIIELEEWKPIKNYEGLYEISSFGRIKCLYKEWIAGKGRKRKKKEHIMRQILMKDYLSFTLCKNGDERYAKTHQLVAIHFIDNPENKPQVNHINGDKLDNRAVNLEWATHTENIRHAFKYGLIKPRYGKDNPKSKLVLDQQTGIYYDAMAEIARAKGYNYKWLSAQLNKRINKTGIIYV